MIGIPSRLGNSIAIFRMIFHMRSNMLFFEFKRWLYKFVFASPKSFEVLVCGWDPCM
jgi:hypothetical protein